jgi:hypothetical protein
MSFTDEEIAYLRSQPLARVSTVAADDLQRAVSWFDRFFGEVQSFERVWTVSEHRHLYVELQPEHAGHAKVTLFVGDFEGFVGAVAQRGIHPETRKTCGNGVHKAVYRDPDGNEVAVGGAPISSH